MIFLTYLVQRLLLFNGIALGGGMELVLSCDYRVMAETAKIGLPENTVGYLSGLGRHSTLTALDRSR